MKDAIRYSFEEAGSHLEAASTHIDGRKNTMIPISIVARKKGISEADTIRFLRERHVKIVDQEGRSFVALCDVDRVEKRST